MDRTLFYDIVNADPGDGEVRAELDFLNHNLTGFTLYRQPLYYRVTQGDLQAPDLIAFKVYNNERFWWVICLANKIMNPCSDLYVGQLLKIPDLLDIYDFFKTYRKR